MRDIPEIQHLTDLRRGAVQAIVGTTHPDGPCLICEEPLSKAPKGEANPLLFVAWMNDINDDESWRMDGVHARCVPKIEVATR